MPCIPPRDKNRAFDEKTQKSHFYTTFDASHFFVHINTVFLPSETGPAPGTESPRGGGSLGGPAVAPGRRGGGEKRAFGGNQRGPKDVRGSQTKGISAECNRGISKARRTAAKESQSSKNFCQVPSPVLPAIISVKLKLPVFFTGTWKGSVSPWPGRAAAMSPTVPGVTWSPWWAGACRGSSPTSSWRRGRSSYQCSWPPFRYTYHTQLVLPTKVFFFQIFRCLKSQYENVCTVYNYSTMPFKAFKF